jgi:tetratricopeptide (TPR) repeat protein
MRLALLLVTVTLVVSGCAGLRHDVPTEPALIKQPETVDEAILIAEDYAANGRWQTALNVLDRALRDTPGDPGLLDKRAALAARWAYQEQSWEDRILLGDAENQRAKIAVLEQLSRAAPDDLLTTSRRLYWKEVLRGKGDALTACAERHVVLQPDLARRCYRIAVDLVDAAEQERRLQGVREQLAEGEQLAEEQRRQRAEKERQLRAKGLLDEARVAIEGNDYRRALDLLARVDALQPDNPEVDALQQSAWSMLSPQVEALVKLGDHLYLDEQLEAAVATWQAALNLKPNDEDITARIARARTVLRRLDALRDRQQPDVAAPPGR